MQIALTVGESVVCSTLPPRGRDDASRTSADCASGFLSTFIDDCEWSASGCHRDHHIRKWGASRSGGGVKRFDSVWRRSSQHGKFRQHSDSRGGGAVPAFWRQFGFVGTAGRNTVGEAAERHGGIFNGERQGICAASFQSGNPAGEQSTNGGAGYLRQRKGTAGAQHARI